MNQLSLSQAKKLQSDRHRVNTPPHGGGPLRRLARRVPEDLISSLLDELLVVVLCHLRCTQEAVRTSVLAHRWRGL